MAKGKTVLPKSIAGQAIQGHPNWAAPKPAPKSIIQQAIQGHPNWAGTPASGVSSAGSAGLNAGVLSTPPPPPPAQAAATPPGAPAQSLPVTPFLTPEQQAQWTAYVLNYQGNVGAQNDKLAAAQYTHDTGAATAQHQHDVNQNMVNQSLAARGMFNSGIQLSDMSDLDTALTVRNTALNTALNTVKLAVGRDIGNLNTAYDTTQTEYNEMAVENAQSITPTPGSAPPPGNAAPPAPAASAAPTPTQNSQQQNASANVQATRNTAASETAQSRAGAGHHQPALTQGLGNIGKALGTGANKVTKPKVPGSNTNGTAPQNYASAMHLASVPQ